MSMQREHMWSAYLDGELSASEAAEFDQSLTPEEKDRLQAEVRFEGALGEFLGRGGACPDDVWQRTKKAVSSKSGKIPWWVPNRQARIFALAAVLMLTVAGVVYQVRFTTPAFINAGTFAIPASELALNTDEVSEVNEFLHTHGVALVLHAPDKEDRSHGALRRKLLGAHEETYKGESMAEIMYECCGKPVKVIIAPKEGVAAVAVRKAIEQDKVQDYRTIGDYVAVTVGTHRSRGLLDLLSEEDTGAEFALRHI